MSLYELLTVRADMIRNGLDIREINMIIEQKEREYVDQINEDVSATGGPSGSIGSSVGSMGVSMANASISGMGNVVSSQPSNYSGVTTDPGFSLGGGSEGSGDLSVPYNTGGKKVYHNVPRKKTDDRFGTNKRRKSKMMAALKTMKKPSDVTPTKKLKRFDEFSEEEMMKIKRVKY